MSDTTDRWTRRGALAAVLAAAGCVQLPGQGPGPREFRVTPKSTFPSDLPRVAWGLSVAEPTADRTLDTNRIAVIRDGLQVEYLADASWIDRAPTMVQGLIVQSFRNSGAITTVGTDRDRLNADFLLQTALRAFYGVAQPGQNVVRVAFAPTLVTLPTRAVVGTTAITADQPVTELTVTAIVTAFDEALGKAMKELVLWTLRTGQTAPPVG